VRNHVNKVLKKQINLWVPKETPCRHWILIFTFLLAILSNRTGLNTNVMSRVALMLAISERQSFEISPWQSLTLDWAKTPNGRYYSNKAPGPSLLATPLFAVLYKPIYWGLKHLYPEPKRFNTAWNNALSFIMWLISFTFQIVPFVWVISRLAIVLEEHFVSRGGILFFIFAAMFGNTGCFYMNCFHGHGYAMVFSLAGIFYLLKKNWVLLGLILGGGGLGDYSSALLIPIILVWVLTMEPSKGCGRVYWALGKGLVFPLIVFAFYHWSSFGGILTLPQKYQNPIFVDPSTDYKTFGVLSLLPKADVLYQLLFGPYRGVLLTQPYILLLSILLPMSCFLEILHRAKASDKSMIGLISVVFFCGLLWMNAGFNGWHGGSAPGPRYLVSVFPIMAFSGALLWNTISRAAQIVLWGTLLFSVAFFAVVLTVGVTPPETQTLRFFYTGVFKNLNEYPQFLPRLGLVVLTFGVGVVMEKRRSLTAKKHG